MIFWIMIRFTESSLYIYLNICLITQCELQFSHPNCSNLVDEVQICIYTVGAVGVPESPREEEDASPYSYTLSSRRKPGIFC